MGLGDAIMATAQARKAKRENPDAHVIVGDGQTQHWSPVFDNNPNITPPESFDRAKAFWIRNHAGNRPYIDYRRTTPTNIVYREDFAPEPGEFFPNRVDTDFADQKLGDRKGFVVIEPHTKGSFSGNKEWLPERWEAVAEGLKDRGVVQVGPGQKRALRASERIVTPSFRWALAVLSRASLLITTDGALHHAAAALHVPAVVLWGARTHPTILGYPQHRNLYTGHGESCGSIAPCSHCRDAMKRITVEMVLEACR
jgi:ADP-heptose:LPS heptosyltransferase